MLSARCFEHFAKAGLVALMRNWIRSATRKDSLTDVVKSSLQFHFVIGLPLLGKQLVHNGDSSVHLCRQCEYK